MTTSAMSTKGSFRLIALENDGPRLPRRYASREVGPRPPQAAATKSITAGRLGKIEIEGDNILLGKPFTFTKENIDEFDF